MHSQLSERETNDVEFSMNVVVLAPTDYVDDFEANQMFYVCNRKKKKIVFIDFAFQLRWTCNHANAFQ